MTDSDDHFQIDALDLANQIVQLGFAFGLQHGLVKIKECIGSISHLGGGWWLRCGCWCRGRRRSHYHRRWCGLGSRNRSRCRLRNDSAIATDSSRRRCPGCIAPAIFVGTVFPGNTGSAYPVVNGLGASHGRECCGSNQHCQFVQFHHGSPKGKKPQQRGEYL